MKLMELPKAPPRTAVGAVSVAEYSHVPEAVSCTTTHMHTRDDRHTVNSGAQLTSGTSCVLCVVCAWLTWYTNTAPAPVTPPTVRPGAPTRMSPLPTPTAAPKLSLATDDGQADKVVSCAHCCVLDAWVYTYAAPPVTAVVSFGAPITATLPDTAL